jgi:plastocyanin
MLPRHVLAATTAAFLLVPAAAQAATKTVYAGPPPANAKALPQNAVGNAFYPRKVSVRAGGKVAFKVGGFHNVMFAPRGQALPPLLAPDPAKPVAGAKDAAGNDFWFNGQPGAFASPLAFVPTGDKRIDGQALDGSGIFMGQGAPPDYVVSFPKRGAYRYLCSVHPGMTGSVKVLGRKAKVPSKAKDAKVVAKQVAATVKAAKRLAAKTPSGNVVRVGSDHAEVAFLSFFPGARKIKAGGAVRFELSKDSTEIHDVAFGPADYLAERSAGFVAPGPQGITVDPLSVYPSDPGPLSYDPAAHGNGYLNTGLIDTHRDSPFPSSASITFPKPGTYAYICTVHGPVMKGTIEVS